MSDTFHCPHCHAEISVDAVACKNCGADDKTAWSSNTLYDGIDLPTTDDEKVYGFKHTQLGKDLKYLVLVILLLAFLGVIFKI